MLIRETSLNFQAVTLYSGFLLFWNLAPYVRLIVNFPSRKISKVPSTIIRMSVEQLGKIKITLVKMHLAELYMWNLGFKKLRENPRK